MESKVCTKCGEEKPLTNFGKDSSRVDNLKYWCKSCSRVACKKWHKQNHEYVKEYERKRTKIAYHNKKDGLYHVYVIPEEHYCGQTNYPRWRRNQHSTNGKITKGFEVVMSFNKREDALQLESCFHKLGWYGKNANY